MRIKVHLEKPTIKIPVNYNEAIQGFIYSYLDPETSNLIHNKGFTIAKKTFKLFSFSRILSFSKPQISKDHFIFKNRISIVICSLIDKIIQELALNLIKKDKVNLANQEMKIHSIEVEKNSIPQGKAIIKTLSPITVYTTFKVNNNKKTYFYKPTEKEFEKSILTNLIEKYRLFCSLKNQTPTEQNEEKILNESYFIPIKYTQNIVIYKNTTIIGYSGTFQANLPDYLYEIALNAGIGSKNSQGFGCIKILSQNNKQEE